MAEDDTQHEQIKGEPPAILRERARWLVWRRVDGRKVPVNPHDTRRAGSSTDPSTWATYEAACEALANDATCEGLGFVFNGDGVVGVDLDHCTDPETGDLEAWARAIVGELGPTYAEWSPSGEGLHIFVLGNLDRAFQARIPGAHARAGLEVYASGRFFTWTGHVFEGAPLDVAERGEALARLEARHRPSRSTHAAREAGPAGEALEDAQLDADIREALRFLDPGSNDVWQPVAMALHHAYAGDVLGWELLCEWSATDPTYSSRVERQNSNRWRSFGRRTARAVVSVGTLFALAADEGWQGRRARAVAPPAPRLTHPDERWDEGAVCVELGEAYERVRREVSWALDGASELVLRVPPGVGKTHATLAALAAHLVDDPELRVAWITRTHATADEAREALRERLREEGAYLGAGSELDRLLGETPVRTQQTCERFDELNAGRHTYPEAVADLCGACERNPNTGAPREAWCPFWEARRTTSARLEVMTHARAMIDLDAGELRADVVVIDENPLDAILTPLELDAGGVAWAADVLGWGREVWAPLVEALARDDELDGVALREHMRAEASRVRQAAAPTRAEQLRHWGTPDQLQAVVRDRVEVADRLAARVEAPPRADDEAERLRVALEHRRAEGKRAMREGRWEVWAAEQPPWEAVGALARTAAHGWTQGRVSGGRLHVVDVWSWATRLDTSTLIVLDATMTRAMADALWPDARYVALRVPQPEHARVWWCPLDLTTRDVEGCGDLRSTRKGLLWSALHGLHADARTLHITHKRYREAQSWVGEALRGVCEAGAPVLHWRGAETRGWNGGATCTRAVLDTWYMPCAPILQLSEVLRGLARADDHDDVRAHWDAEALHHTRGAEIIQAAHRVRLLRATPERPVDLILAMQDDPRAYGLELHDQLDTGELVWEAHGVCWRGAVGAVRAMLRDALASTPTLAPLRSTLNVGDVWRAPSSTPILDIAARAHADVLDRERSRRVGEVLENARRVQGWSWEALAAELGVGLAYAYDGDAGAPTPLLHTEGLELGDVFDAAPAWCVAVARTPGGERVERREELELGDVLDALDLLDGNPSTFGGIVTRLEALPVWNGVRVRQRVRDALRAWGGAGSLRMAWLEHHATAQLHAVPLLDNNGRTLGHRAVAQAVGNALCDLERATPDAWMTFMGSVEPAEIAALAARLQDTHTPPPRRQAATHQPHPSPAYWAAMRLGASALVESFKGWQRAADLKALRVLQGIQTDAVCALKDPLNLSQLTDQLAAQLANPGTRLAADVFRQPDWRGFYGQMMSPHALRRASHAAELQGVLARRAAEHQIPAAGVAVAAPPRVAPRRSPTPTGAPDRQQADAPPSKLVRVAKRCSIPPRTYLEANPLPSNVIPLYPKPVEVEGPIELLCKLIRQGECPNTRTVLRVWGLGWSQMTTRARSHHAGGLEALVFDAQLAFCAWAEDGIDPAHSLERWRLV